MDLRRALWLAGALAVLAYAALIPHGSLPGNTWSPYPVHMDEYLHWGYAKATADQGTVQFSDPFTGSAAGNSLVLKERGFHAYMAAFQQVSGLEWATLVEYTPVVVSVFLGLATYTLAERWNAGIQAILLLAAVPTTIRFLGVGFFVPIAFSLPLLLLGIDALGRTHEGGFSAFIVLAPAIWFVHPMAGATLVVFLVAFAAVMNRRADRTLLAATVFGLVLFTAAWPIYQGYVRGGLPLAFLPPSLDEFRAALPLLAGAGVGAALASLSDDPRSRAVAFSLAIGAAFLEAIMIVRLASGRDAFFLYDRSFLIVHLLAAVLAAIAVARVWAWGRRSVARRRWDILTVALLVAFVLPTFAIASSWDHQRHFDRYEMLNDARFASYSAAANALDRRLPRAIVDGLPTMAWTDVTGVSTIFVWSPSGAGMPAAHERFFASGANDTQFLVENSVTLVVTTRAVTDPDLVKIAPGVYQLRPELVDKIVAAEALHAKT